MLVAAALFWTLAIITTRRWPPRTPGVRTAALVLRRWRRC